MTGVLMIIQNGHKMLTIKQKYIIFAVGLLLMTVGRTAEALPVSHSFLFVTHNLNSNAMSKKENLIGQKFGRLTVIDFAEPYVWKNKNFSQFKCMCDCGNEIVIRASKLKNGHTKSCGCFHKEQLSKRNKKHGLSDSTEYKTWSHIRDRCYNKNNKDYRYYGGRGIKACDRWLGEKGFENFLADMGKKPSPKHSIDRIDNNRDYTPENCRWATLLEQANNKNWNVFLTYNNKTQTIAQWARELNVHVELLYGRKKLGWDDIDILTIKSGSVNSIKDYKNGMDNSK